MSEITKDILSDTTISTYRGEPFDSDYYTAGLRSGYSHYDQTIKAYLDIVIDDIEYELGSDIFTDNSLKALDIGCATGLHVDALNQRGLDTDGLDISSYAIGEANTKYPSFTFINEDIISNTIPSNSYDIIIAIGLFGCMTNKIVGTGLWGQINRIAKAGWRAYITLNIGHNRYLNYSAAEVATIAIPDHIVTITNLLDSGISDPDELIARTTVGSYGWKVVIT